METTINDAAALIRQKRRRKIKRAIFLVTLLGYPVAHLAVFSIYVNIGTVFLSLEKIDRAGVYRFVGFQNFIDMFNEMRLQGSANQIISSLVNSLWFFVVNNAILLPLSILGCFFIFKRIRFSRFYRVVFFLPSIISVVVLTLVYKFMFNSTFGPINSLLRAIGLGGVIPEAGWLGTPKTSLPLVMVYCVWAGIGYNMVLIQGAMSRVPPEILESGRIEGISMPRELCQIILPIIFPTISTLILIGSTAIFTVFLQPLLLTGGAANPNGISTLALLVVLNTKSGLPSQQITAATLGMLITVIGAPLMLLLKWFLERVTPSVEY